MDADPQRIEIPPLVSVIMPIRNEAATIGKSVSAILQQNYPSSSIEIIIADGCSEDKSVEIIRQLPGGNAIKIIPNERRIQAAGLNRALKLAQGQIIIRVDGHTVIAPDYIHQCVKLLQLSGSANVGGPLNPVWHTTMGHAIACASKSRFAVPTDFRVSRKAGYVDTVYMGAWWHYILDQVGNFDERLTGNEDYELNYRIRKAGERIYYSPYICSDYYGQETLIGLARQYFRYGYWKSKMLRIHPASLRLRQLAAPFLVVFIVIGGLGSLGSESLFSFWIAGLLAYAATNIVFSLQAGRKTDFGALLRLPLVFLTIHAAWGYGFWYGMLRPLREWLFGKFTQV